jgi:hypothetical protein
MTEATMSDVSAGLKEFINGYASKSADKKFHMPYQRKNLALDLVKLHDDRFSSLGGDKYFACVDMRGTDGKPLYNWKEEKGVWKKSASFVEGPDGR